LQHAFRKTIEMQGEKSSFEGIWTHDDDPPAHLDSLRKGQRRCLLVKPVLATWAIRSHIRKETVIEEPFSPPARCMDDKNMGMRGPSMTLF
jgi:hypothetical protein